MNTALNTARAVPVLMYHHVSPAAGAVTVSPVHFADQMAMLAREGYTTLGARAFSEFLAGKPVPAKSVVLTFDDGYLDNWFTRIRCLQNTVLPRSDSLCLAG